MIEKQEVKYEEKPFSTVPTVLFQLVHSQSLLMQAACVLGWVTSLLLASPPAAQASAINSATNTAPSPTPGTPSNTLAPLSKTTSSKGAVGWRPVGIPKGKVPMADFALIPQDGRSVLRLRTDSSYGTWVHDVPRLSLTDQAVLSWHWRVDEPVEAANLRTKAGDDAAVKVCVSFDMPTKGLAFSESAVLKLARAATGENLPAATLCYVWDSKLAVGTQLANAYSKRVRFIVVDGAASSLGQWRSMRRNVAQDFLQAFGHESKTVPPVVAVIVGADSDNTKGKSLAYVADVRLQ